MWVAMLHYIFFEVFFEVLKIYLQFWSLIIALDEVQKLKIVRYDWPF